MYESYFGLREKPFSLLPDPDFLFLGKNHRESLTMLEYGLANQAGFTVLSGEIGSGKTTLIRYLLNQLDEETVVGLITNTHASLGTLLQWVSAAFDLEYASQDKLVLYNRLIEFLVSEYAAGRRVVLIVDEAQNMNSDMLEELRMLSNLNADKHQVLQIVLVGQPELLATLRAPALRQFVQRISVNYHLGPMNRVDTRAYILHRLAVVGAHEPIFDDAALDAVYSAAQGIPRLVNLACDTALVYAFGEQKRTIGAELINEVLEDKERTGLGLLFSAMSGARTRTAAGEARAAQDVVVPMSGSMEFDPEAMDKSAPEPAVLDVEHARELFSALRPTKE